MHVLGYSIVLIGTALVLHGVVLQIKQMFTKR